MEKKISLAAMLVFGVRLVIKGASIGDAAALSALCALYGFILFLETKKEKPINDSVKAELDQIRTTLNSLKLNKLINKI